LMPRVAPRASRTAIDGLVASRLLFPHP
jgi:hypothetical protein